MKRDVRLAPPTKEASKVKTPRWPPWVRGGRGLSSEAQQETRRSDWQPLRLLSLAEEHGIRRCILLFKVRDSIEPVETLLDIRDEDLSKMIPSETLARIMEKGRKRDRLSTASTASPAALASSAGSPPSG